MNRHRVITADAVLSGPGRLGDTLVVEDGRIAAITDGGHEADTHFEGGVIVPRFVDSHFHPFEYAATKTGLSLGTPEGMEELRQRLVDADADHPPGEALIAHGLDDSSIGRMPTASELGTVSVDRPILVHRVCRHVASANRAALKAAGIDEGSPDPTGGAFRRQSGDLTGVCEETAVTVISSALAPLVPTPSAETVLDVLGHLAPSGISRLGAMVAITAGDTLDGVIDTLVYLGDRLPIHLDIIVNTGDPGMLAAVVAGLRDAHMVRFWGWKGFADGSLGGRTAALATPYHDAPDAIGTTRLEPVPALKMTRTSLELGGVSAIHAIGDAALTDVLEVFARAIEEGADPKRLRVEHASVASSELIARMADLGVVASVQPSFPVSDATWLEDRLGPERRRWAYPFTELAAAGVPLIFSSDAPVEEPDVVTAMGHAVASGLTPNQALAGYTTTPSDFLGIEEPLAVGSSADFVVIDGPPGTAGRVLEVWSKGEPISLRQP